MVQSGLPVGWQTASTPGSSRLGGVKGEEVGHVPAELWRKAATKPVRADVAVRIVGRQDSADGGDGLSI
jgi:hypothetical protein